MVRHLFGNGMLGVLAVALASAFTTSQPASAESLNRDWIHARAQWLMHIDVQRLVESRIGQYLIEHHEQLDLDLSELKKIKRETGVHPFEDIEDITVYGRGNPEDKNVAVIVRSNEKVDDLVERMREEGGEHYHNMIFDGIEFHVWDEKEDMMLLHVRDDDEPGRRIAVLGRNPKLLAHVIGVIEGDKPSVAGGDEALLRARPQNGSMLYMEASAAPWIGKKGNPASKIARHSDHVAMDIAERDEQMSFLLSISAKSEQDAKNVSDVLQGLVALGRLMGDEKPELQPLVDLMRGVAVTARDRDIQINMQRETSKIIEAIEKSAARKRRANDEHQNAGNESARHMPRPREDRSRERSKSRAQQTE